MAAITSLTSEASANKYTVVITNAGFAGKEADFKTLITAIFNKIDTVITDVNTHKTQEEIEDIVGAMFDGGTETRVSATYDDTSGKINLVVDDMSGDNNTTYSISCVDGDNSDEEKIRLTAGGSGSGTDDIVLEAGTGLSIARDADKITFTNTVSDTNTNELTTFTISDGSSSQTIGHNDTLTFTDGEGIDIAVSATDTVTISGEEASSINKGVAAFSTDNFLVSTGNVTIKDLGVATAELDNRAVTYAKMQNVTADRILGRITDTGSPTELTAANVLSLIGVTAGANPNVSGDSGNAAVYDNGGTPTLKSGITQAEMRTAIGAGTSDLALGTSGSTALAGNTAVGDSNVKSNWNESDTNADSFIQNKPNVQYTSAISTGNNGLVPSAGTAGHFLKHNGTFGQIEYSNINSAPQEFDNDNSGLVPNPGSTGTTTKFLREDGTFQVPAYIANSNDDVSVANLDARLEQLTATMVTVGDATDVTIDFEGGIQIGQGAVFMTEPTVSVGAGITAWSWTQGNKLDLTLASGATAITFDTPHPQGGCSLTLKLTQPASGSAGTAGSWNASGAGNNVKWPSGTAPTLSTANGAVDILSFYWDGTNYYGVASLNFS